MAMFRKMGEMSAKMGKMGERMLRSTPAAASRAMTAGKNIAKGAGEGMKEMGSKAYSGAKKLGKPSGLKGKIAKIAKDPNKMKALGKKLAKFGVAAGAGYGAAKMMGGKKNASGTDDSKKY